MANPPKPSANHTPAATARPPAAPSHADDPPAPGTQTTAAPPKHAAEIDISKLSYTTSTCIGRLEAGKAEVTAWTKNLENSLQADVDSGVLTHDDGVAVAEKYEVRKPTPKPAEEAPAA